MNATTFLRAMTALCLGSLAAATFGQSRPTSVPLPAKASAKAASSTKAVVNYGRLPLSFESNLGQTSPKVQWLARGPEYTLYLAGSDAVLQMNRITAGKSESANPSERQPSISSSVVRMDLLGASAGQKAAGEEPQAGKANYFTGKDPAKWQRDVPMYGKVRMNGVYPGVDLVYYGHQGALEYDFVVAPGANASAIKLGFEGSKATLAANGDLVLPVEGGPGVRFNKPVVYQTVDGVRQPVEGSFVIADGKSGEQISFQLGAYDHGRELVIDPTFLFVGVLGTGNYETQASGIAVDAAGEIILTGATSDVDFPATAGAYQTTCNQDSPVAAAHNYVRCGGYSEGYLGSAFITKISADGTSLVYATYLHGFSGSEYGQAVAVDAAGDAVVLGETGSYDFPVTSNAYQSLCMPYYQPIGVAGGSPSDFYPIGQHCDGYYAGGGTEWVSGGPTLFIAKLNPAGSALVYSTFFGGTNPTYPTALALDAAGNIYFTSYLQGAEEYLSNGTPVVNVYPQNGTVPFPVTGSAFQQFNLAQQVATLSVLSADGQSLLYSTLFGATNTTSPAWVQPTSLAVGPNGIAYVGGQTYSDGVPTTSGSVRPACVDSSVYNGGNEYGNCEAYTGWLAAFDTTQSGSASLKYGTYIGGPEIPGGNSPQNQVWGLAADSENNVYVTGLTTSSSYPTTAGAYQTACMQVQGLGQTYCGQSAFLTKINPTGSEYVWSTLFEGNQQSNDYGQNIAFDSSGNVYLYGYDNNYTFDLPWVNPLEGRPGSNTGASYPFLATFSPDGSKLLFSTPLGNTNPNAGNDFPVGMVLDSANNIYFAGYGADGGTMASTPGTYATTASGTGPRTYFGKISPLNVALAITWPTPTAINYGTALSATQLNASANVAGSFTYSPVLGTVLPAGLQTLSATFTPQDTSDYATTTVTVQLTVNKAQLTVGPHPPQAGTSQFSVGYGDNAPYAYDLYVITGFVNEDTASVLSGAPTATPVWGAQPNIGTYPLTIGVGTLSAANYTFTAVSGTITVVPGILVIKPYAPSIKYGSPLPTLGYLATGLAYGQTAASVMSAAPQLSTTATAHSGAGVYTVSANVAGITAANYVVVAGAPGTLTVQPETLVARATNIVAKHGAALPALTYQVTGFVNGDTGSVLSGTATLSTTATQASPAGTYPITFSTETLSAANYSIVYTGATLTLK